MKYTELLTKTEDELHTLLKEKQIFLFHLKQKLHNMQITNVAELKETRKFIARISTAISAKLKGIK